MGSFAVSSVRIVLLELNRRTHKISLLIDFHLKRAIKSIKNSLKSIFSLASDSNAMKSYGSFLQPNKDIMDNFLHRDFNV